MGVTTNIEWTDATWNPIRGCSRVSEGCRNCYAERVAYRFSGPGKPYEGLAHKVNGHAAWTGKVALAENHLLDPLKWKGRPLYHPDMGTRPVGYDGGGQRIFVNSMSDLFHENVADEWIDRIFAVMALCPQHTFQILTKRPERCWDYWFNVSTQHRLFWIAHAIDELIPERTSASIAAKERLFEGGPISNVLHGFSAEDQKTFDARWNIMGRMTACAFPTFASLEPLLGAIDMGDGRVPDWVICGGESGPGARPMHPDWSRSLRDQCQAAGVPFFFKQWGEWVEVKRETNLPAEPWMIRAGDKMICRDGTSCVVNRDLTFELECIGLQDDARPMRKLGKKAAGALLDGVEWKEFPGGKR